LVTLGLAFVPPLLYPGGASSAGFAGTSGPGPGTTIGVGSTSAEYNAEKNLWIYKISVSAQSGEAGEIVGVMAISPSGKQTIAPPFGENIDVTGGKKTPEMVTIKPGATAELIIYSKDPLWHITLIDQKGKRWQISFWG